jgi:hypothetical protein
VKIGFTGTREGMTVGQIAALTYLLNEKIPRPVEAHHGDCVGADAEFHDLVRELLPGSKIVIHPPIKDTHRAFKAGDEVWAQFDYLLRNAAIVSESEAVIAAPKSMADQTGGTWWTIRDARKQKVRLLILEPDGAITYEWHNKEGGGVNADDGRDGGG